MRIPLSDGRSEETSDAAKIQQRHKEPRLETAVTTGKQENTQEKCQ